MSGEDPGIVIYADSLKNWEPPYQGEQLTDDEMQRIKNNVLVDLVKHQSKAEWGEKGMRA